MLLARHPMELRDQRVQAGGRDDQIAHEPGPGVAERVGDTRRDEHRRAGVREAFTVSARETQPALDDVPRLVVAVVDVQGRDLTDVIAAPLPDNEVFAPCFGPRAWVRSVGWRTDDNRVRHPTTSPRYSL